MANNYRECLTCTTHYHYCPTCSRDTDKPSFMRLYCSENCKTIFNAANDYNFGLISIEEAKSIIEACDLTDLESFNETVKNDVKKILAADAEPKKAPKKVAKDEMAD